MNKKIIIGVVILAIILIIWMMSSGPSETKTGSSGSIKVGALLILSGDLATYGEGSKQGIELAVEDFELQNPDKKVEVIYEDTRGEAKEAVSAYKKLTDIDKVDGILGPLFQTQVGAVYSLVSAGNTPVIAISPLPVHNRNQNKNPLGFWPDPTIESGELAKHVYSQGIRNIGVIGTNDSWENEVTNGFIDSFKSLGGKITQSEIVLPETTDIRLAVSKVLSGKPEAIYLGTYMQFIRAAKSLQDQGYRGKLFGIEVDSYLVDETKPYTDGMQFISLDLYTNNFAERIESKYGQKPNIPAGQAYDAAMILFDTLFEYGSGERSIKALGEMKSYDGVSGHVEFKDHNRAEFVTPIFEVKDGVIVKVK